MFVSNSLIFLELQKTGSTHIAKLLAQILPGKQTGQHNRLPNRLLDGKRCIVGSIRNPWDWYVSLWGYGCDAQGGLYYRLTSRRLQRRGLNKNPLSAISILNELRRPRGKWRSTYLGSDQPELFRKWLYLMFDSSRRHDLGEGYAQATISLFAGFFTYRYIHLFSRDITEIYDRTRSIRDLEGLQKFDAQYNILDHVIRNESLTDDLIKVLGYCGINLTEAQLNEIRSAKQTNTSSRKRAIEYYYDRDTAELVRSKDRFIIDKYGYVMPDL